MKIHTYNEYGHFGGYIYFHTQEIVFNYHFGKLVLHFIKGLYKFIFVSSNGVKINSTISFVICSMSFFVTHKMIFFIVVVFFCFVLFLSWQLSYTRTKSPSNGTYMASHFFQKISFDTIWSILWFSSNSNIFKSFLC